MSIDASAAGAQGAAAVYLDAAGISAIAPDGPPLGRSGALASARSAMQATDCWRPGQQMGQRWPIACVALEITQRCNLDCTLCYLSEHSEAVHDVPLAEVFRRIDTIGHYYGRGVDVQVTGGDPTLRRRDELIAIVQRLAEQGQRPTLMTNGIKASPSLLNALGRAGLSDVVFHVDTTQERKDSSRELYPDEASLNPIRERYIKIARQAGLNVMFNTTVHAGNLAEIPALARFFATHAGDVRTASFQLHADTGRGVWRERHESITIESVWRRIEAGAGCRLSNDVSLAGHSSCSRYGLGLLANGRVHDLFDEAGVVQSLQDSTATLQFDRANPHVTLLRLIAWGLRHPRQVAGVAGWGLRKLTAILSPRSNAEIITHRHRAGTVSFVVHNFMHACELEAERIQACIFKVMTGDGPLSMCVHNANRDAYILAPIAISGPSPRSSGTTASSNLWHPLGTASTDTPRAQPIFVSAPDPVAHGLKHSKGRTRATLLSQRPLRRPTVAQTTPLKTDSGSLP